MLMTSVGLPSKLSVAPRSLLVADTGMSVGGTPYLGAAFAGRTAPCHPGSAAVPSPMRRFAQLLTKLWVRSTLLGGGGGRRSLLCMSLPQSLRERSKSYTKIRNKHFKSIAQSRNKETLENQGSTAKARGR